MKTDCYFCGEYRDMGASFNVCNYYADLEKGYYANCDKCRRYIPKKTADLLIRLHVDEQIYREDYPEMF